MGGWSTGMPTPSGWPRMSSSRTVRCSSTGAASNPTSRGSRGGNSSRGASYAKWVISPEPGRRRRMALKSARRRAFATSTTRCRATLNGGSERISRARPLSTLRAPTSRRSEPPSAAADGRSSASVMKPARLGGAPALPGSSLRHRSHRGWAGGEPQPPVLVGHAVDREPPGETAGDRERNGPEVDGQREVDRRSLRNSLRAADLEVPPDLHGLVAIRSRDVDELAIGVLQVELPVVGPVSLVPVDVELDADGGRRGVGPCHAPAAAEDEQLSFGDLGRVAQNHRHLHGPPTYRSGLDVSVPEALACADRGSRPGPPSPRPGRRAGAAIRGVTSISPEDGVQRAHVDPVVVTPVHRHGSRLARCARLVDGN